MLYITVPAGYMRGVPLVCRHLGVGVRHQGSVLNLNMLHHIMYCWA